MTGADGYIGRHAVKALIKRGCDVVAICRKPSQSPFLAGAEVFVTDIFSDKDLSYDSLGRPDALLHLAWSDGFSHNSEIHLESIPRHYKFITALTAEGLSQVAVAGSMHEFGHFNGVIDDFTVPQPENLYGLAKASLAKALQIKFDGESICFQWLRMFYVFGDDAHNGSVFRKMLDADNAGLKLFPFTDGKDHFDFLHINELSEMLAASVLQREVRGEINCCSGRTTAIGEFAKKFIRDRKLSIELQLGEYATPNDSRRNVTGDITKIRSIMEAHQDAVT